MFSPYLNKQTNRFYAFRKPIQMQKKKSTLLTEAIARAKIKEWEEKQKADPLVQAKKRNEKNLRKSWEEFYLK